MASSSASGQRTASGPSVLLSIRIDMRILARKRRKLPDGSLQLSARQEF